MNVQGSGVLLLPAFAAGDIGENAAGIGRPYRRDGFRKGTASRA
jgi:hypothetical protein